MQPLQVKQIDLCLHQISIPECSGTRILYKYKQPIRCEQIPILMYMTDRQGAYQPDWMHKLLHNASELRLIERCSSIKAANHFVC